MNSQFTSNKQPESHMGVFALSYPVLGWVDGKDDCGISKPNFRNR